jgi:hypothetical protein
MMYLWGVFKREQSVKLALLGFTFFVCFKDLFVVPFFSNVVSLFKKRSFAAPFGLDKSICGHRRAKSIYGHREARTIYGHRRVKSIYGHREARSIYGH